MSDQARALKHLSPVSQMVQGWQRVDDLMERARKAVAQRLGIHRERLEALRGRLAAVGPIGTLKRGYAIVKHGEDQAIVSSVEQVAPRDRLNIRVVDGEFEAEAR